MEDLQHILQEAQKNIAAVTDAHSLDQVKARYLGKKSELTDYLKNLGQMNAEERPRVGQAVNAAKNQLQEWIKVRSQEISEKELAAALASQTVDVTLTGRGQTLGSLHPVTLTTQRFINYFTQLGFEVVEGPEIEDDYHNFTALNIPENHPARAAHDTFYFPGGLLLRTHTSPVQIRSMKNQKPPIRIIAPGRTYRCDSDLRHTPMFHQVEVLMIDEKTNFSHLKAILTEFIKYFFEQDLAVRFRPSYFPFTEPSAEVDMQCASCQGKGCRVCSHTGWLEILGSGMVHPNVLANVGIDSEKYSGFAFGLGLERLAMLYYKIDDMRLLFDNDVRFLNQF